jgi:DNA-directed RNA polymerase specialized sigma24 family protein
MDLAKIRELYPVMSNAEIARIVGCNVATVKYRAYQMGLRKDADCLSEINRRNGCKKYGR